MLDDPLAGFRDLMAQAPAADHAVLADPQWQEAFSLATREGLAIGVDGWTDETRRTQTWTAEYAAQTSYSSSYRCVPSSSTVRWKVPAMPWSAPWPDPGTSS